MVRVALFPAAAVAPFATPKDEIDRLEYRPAQGRATRDTKTTVDGGARKQPKTGMNGIPGKSSFETQYRRQAAAPKK